MSVIAANPRTVTGRPRVVAEPAMARRKPDYWVLAAVVGLCLVGVIMVYSASYAQSLAENPDGKGAVYALRQVQNLLTGGVALLVFALVPYTFWRRLSVPLGALVLIALVLALFAPEAISPEINGAHRCL